MQTPRDHVHAYQFMVNRMTSALVVGDPATFELPARRAWMGTVIGSIVAVLVFGGFVVYGFLRPGGNPAWRDSHAILVEKETGTRYVVIDGVLRPTLNQASALLIKGDGASVQSVSRGSLAGLPHGAPVGILGAPDPVPSRGDLIAGPLVMCAVDRGTSTSPTPVLIAGWPNLPARPLEADRYRLVRDPGGTTYLIWAGARHRIADDHVTLALGMPGGAAPMVSSSWLNLVPAGPPLAIPAIRDTGRPGPDIAGDSRPVGQLFRQQVGGRDQLFVLLTDGLAPVSEPAFALLSAQPGTAPITISTADLVAAPRSADTSLADLFSGLTSATADNTPGTSLCVTGSTARLVLVSGVPGDRGVAVLPPGRGLLVATAPRAGERTPDRYLITEQGARFRVPDDQSLAALGLSGTTPVAIDTAMVTALPEGPELSRAAVGVSTRG